MVHRMIGWLAMVVAVAMPFSGNVAVQPVPDVHAGAQIYAHQDDVRVPHNLPLDPEACTPAVRAQLAADYGHPPMIAMGDSLYNGVQALRINWWLSEWSPPAVIAIRLGLIEERRADRTGRRQFYTPQYKSYLSRPDETIDYGLSVERLGGGGPLSRWASLFKTGTDQERALRDLMNTYTPPNGRVFVDNIAFSGANSIDLVEWTAADHRSEARHYLDRLRNPFFGFPALGDAFTHANAAFVLNPTRHPCVEQMTPLEQIKFRQPERLFINIGANNGIFRAAFGGTPITAPSCGENGPRSGGKLRCVPGRDISHFLKSRLISDLEAMALDLAETDIGYVYINGVAEPSGTANVLITKGRDGSVTYRRAFTNTPIAAGVIEDADQAARDANHAIQRVIQDANARRAGHGPLFVFVDTNAVLQSRDYKGCMAHNRPDCANHRVRAVLGRDMPDILLDNRPLTVGGETNLDVSAGYVPRIREGGLFSFDNMHLSITGYELMVYAVRLAMDATNDPLIQARVAGCAARGEPRYPSLEPGDCRRAMIEPGVGYGDATRRQFTFERQANDESQKDRNFIAAAFRLFGI